MIIQFLIIVNMLSKTRKQKKQTKQQQTRKRSKKTQETPNITERIPKLKTLNDDQQEAILHINGFLETEQKFFLLSGGAGTGKTYTIGALIAKLQGENQKLWIAAAAPTNKAVKVLKQTTQSWGVHNIDYGTIYQFLGLKMDYDDEGERVLVEGNRSTIDKYNLIILDEASMVSTKLWSLLNQIVKRYNSQIICLGDKAQLPPVNEPESPVFSQIIHQSILNQVMRTKEDNPVMDMIQAARHQVFNPQQYLKLQSNFTPDLMRGCWVLNREIWLQQMIRAFQSPKYQSNPDHVRAIAWTNKTVNYLNQYIREAIFEDAKQPFVIGERLVATDTIFDSIDGEEIILANSSEFEVIAVRQTVSQHGYNIWSLNVIDEENNRHRLNVIDQSSLKYFEDDLRHLAAKAKQQKQSGVNNPWQPYWQLKNCYANVNYAYAITSHKSQGSTFNNVFVAQQDICRNYNHVERYKSLYVSYSRASDRLLINI